MGISKSEIDIKAGFIKDQNTNIVKILICRQQEVERDRDYRKHLCARVGDFALVEIILGR